MTFEPSLRFELFYALASVFDRTARVHPAWRLRAKRELPASFWRDARVFGKAREVWLAVPAALPHDQPLADWDSLWAALRSADPRELAANMLKGLLHARELVDDMMSARSVRRLISKVPRAERDWLRTLGLDPYRRTAPLAVAIEALVQDPAGSLRTMTRMVRRFWDGCFARSFHDAHAQYASVARGLEEYWKATSLSELCDQALLRIRVKRDELESVEGAYRVRLRDIERMVVLPSAFNERRYWSAVSGRAGTIVYIPCFEPSIEIAGGRRRERPLLPVLRALADHSRWKMVQALLTRPQAASELAVLCKLRRATVSHHVRVLCDAELVSRSPRRGTVLLTANRATLRGLGDRILDLDGS